MLHDPVISKKILALQVSVRYFGRLAKEVIAVSVGGRYNSKI
jgi:hypothetical protein